jgi:hypothetical protein
LASDSNAFAAGTDAAGNVYVAGSAYDAMGRSHAIVRTNAGGTWTTDDDFFDTVLTVDGYATDYGYSAFASDPVTGALYAGGNYYDWSTDASGWQIRSTAAATGPATFSTISISSSMTDGSTVKDPLQDLLA